MSLEEYTPDESAWESSGSSSEKAREMSEKFKEQVRKASAWIKRTQKDEKKAKKQDMLLANFLVKLILNKKFDNLLDLLFKLIDKWYSSNFLLGILSLIYKDISDKIREINNIEVINFDYIPWEEIDFNDENIDSQIKQRINFWVEDIILSSTADYSSLLTNRLIKLLEKKEDDILLFMIAVFDLFLNDLNIKINDSEKNNIISFILSEILKKIKTLDLEEI